MRSSEILQPFILSLTLTALFVSTPLLAQRHGTLSGVVVDRNSADPIPRVNIYLRGTDRGTVTDSLGRFLLPVPVGAVYNVVFSHVAYATEVYNVQFNSAIEQRVSVELKPRPVGLLGQGRRKPSAEQNL